MTGSAGWSCGAGRWRGWPVSQPLIRETIPWIRLRLQRPFAFTFVLIRLVDGFDFVGFGAFLGLFDNFSHTAGDRRDGEIAVGDRRLCAFRQLDVGDLDVVANVEAGEVSVELLGDAVCANVKFDSVTHHVERAATLQAWRCFLIVEVDRHLNGDDLFLVHSVKVDVQRHVRDRVHLDRLRDHELLLAIVDKVCRGGEEVAGIDRLDHFVELQGDRHRLFVAAIQDAGDHIVAAGFACAALTGALAHFHVETELFRHCLFLSP